MGESSPGATRKALAAGALAAMVAGLIWAARGERPEPATAAAPAEPAPPPAASDPGPAPAAGEPAPEAPDFDVVRVAPDGAAVVAGRAAPGAKVTILADGAPLAEAEADAEGNFVAIFRAEPSAAPRALTLEAEHDGGQAASDEVVMLLPPAPETAKPGEEEPAGGDAAAAAPPAEADAEPRVAATAIVGPEGVEVTPAEAAPGPGARRVSLASISYAEQGEVTLAGLGTSGARLRAYVDGALAAQATIGEDGRWSLELPDVAEGVYTLRIDQLGPDGRVASRIETPFQRDLPRPPPRRPGATGPEGSITVQPGNNLWTLARTHYGSGVLYTQIFTANRELIRDPDLIYPGQIFTLPELGAGE